MNFALENGIIDTKNLLFNRGEDSTFKEHLEPDAYFLVQGLELLFAELLMDLSFNTNFEKKNFTSKFLKDDVWKTRLNLN